MDPKTGKKIPSGMVVKKLTKKFSNGVVANNCLSFSVRKGEIFGLLGHNGAGKSKGLGCWAVMGRGRVREF